MSVNVGIISLAHMHVFSYIECLKKMKNVNITGFFDDEPERAKNTEKNSGISYFDSLTALLNEGCDALIICSENNKHLEYLSAGAEKVKYILCEKPVATNIDHCLKMKDICRDKNIEFQTAFPVRFTSPVESVKTGVNNGLIGKIKAIEATNRGTMPGGWFINKNLSGGGAVIDHTVHVIDLVRWITSSEPISVYSEIDTKFYDIDVDDCGILFVEFADDFFITLDTSWSVPEVFPTWGDVTMEIIGEKGVISLDVFSQNINLYINNEKKYQWTNWGDNMDFYMIKSFIDSVENKTPVSVTLDDGIKAVEVAIAAYTSAREKKVVKLPLIK